MEKEVKKINSRDFQEYLRQQDLEKLHKIKLYLDDKYYNEGESPVEDNRYDVLKDMIKEKDASYVPSVGAKLREGENRTKIPYFMGSADKITPANPDVLERWKRDNSASEYVISDKLDGVSCLAVIKNGEIKLYTRGDGYIGADISYLAPYFKIPKTEDIVVRGELIIKKATFEKKYRDKVVNGRSYRNSRNMTAGLIGGKTARQGLEDIDFVCYEIIGDSMPKPSKQFKKLKKLGFKTAKYEIIDEVGVEKLSKSYVRFREESEYEIDGVIVLSDVDYDRNTSGNPEYMFAWKMMLGDAVHEATIEKVEWNTSKWGQLKPTVLIYPVKLQDITISRLTAHNAKYVEENKLGPGAIIKITRSNEVIPYIVDVVKQADEPQMPEVEYTWDKNHVNIVVKQYDNIICIKLISSFFAKLGIKHVSEATVGKMFANGLDNLLKIVAADEKRLLQVPEFQQRSAERIYTNIHNGLKNVKLSTVLGASGVFGFSIGRKRMDMLLLDIPNLLSVYKTRTKQQMVDLVLKVEGFSDILANQVVNNLKYADKFIQQFSKYATFQQEKRVNESMKGHKYVLSGFRDKKLEDSIGERGGKVTTSVSKNTTALIIAQKGGKLTGKPLKANELGIPIYAKDDFIANFLN